jgi:hypothetical protein
MKLLCNMLLIAAPSILASPVVSALDYGNSTRHGPDNYLDAVRAQRQALLDQHMRDVQEAADARRDAVQEELDQRRRALDERADQHREQIKHIRRERIRQHYYPYYAPDYYGWGNPWSYTEPSAAP